MNPQELASAISAAVAQAVRDGFSGVLDDTLGAENVEALRTTLPTILKGLAQAGAAYAAERTVAGATKLAFDPKSPLFLPGGIAELEKAAVAARQYGDAAAYAGKSTTQIALGIADWFRQNVTLAPSMEEGIKLTTNWNAQLQGTIRNQQRYAPALQTTTLELLRLGNQEKDVLAIQNLVLRSFGGNARQANKFVKELQSLNLQGGFVPGTLTAITNAHKGMLSSFGDTRRAREGALSIAAMGRASGDASSALAAAHGNFSTFAGAIAKYAELAPVVARFGGGVRPDFNKLVAQDPATFNREVARILVGFRPAVMALRGQGRPGQRILSQLLATLSQSMGLSIEGTQAIIMRGVQFPRDVPDPTGIRAAAQEAVTPLARMQAAQTALRLMAVRGVLQAGPGGEQAAVTGMRRFSISIGGIVEKSNNLETALQNVGKQIGSARESGTFSGNMQFASDAMIGLVKAINIMHKAATGDDLPGYSDFVGSL